MRAPDRAPPRPLVQVLNQSSEEMLLLGAAAAFSKRVERRYDLPMWHWPRHFLARIGLSHQAWLGLASSSDFPPLVFFWSDQLRLPDLADLCPVTWHWSNQSFALFRAVFSHALSLDSTQAVSRSISLSLGQANDPPVLGSGCTCSGAPTLAIEELLGCGQYHAAPALGSTTEATGIQYLWEVLRYKYVSFPSLFAPTLLRMPWVALRAIPDGTSYSRREFRNVAGAVADWLTFVADR